MPRTSLKQSAIRAAGRFLRSTPAAWLARGFFRRRCNIVFLHGVWERGTPRKDLFTGLYTDEFAALLGSLRRFFEFVDLERVLSAARADDAPARPLIHLTFDDGLDLIGGGALDVMRDLGISSTVFVNTACLGNQHLMWQHLLSAVRATRGDETFVTKLNALQERTGHSARVVRPARQIDVTRHWPMARKDEYAAELWTMCDMPPLADFLAEHRPYMNLDALESWIGAGQGVGFHTHSHPFSSQLDDRQFEAEFIAPLAGLQSALGLDSVPFAYPFGDRLQPEREKRLATEGHFSCLLGTGRFSRRDESHDRLDRVEIEAGADTEVFARPIARSLRHWLGRN